MRMKKRMMRRKKMKKKKVRNFYLNFFDFFVFFMLTPFDFSAESDQLQITINTFHQFNQLNLIKIHVLNVIKTIMTAVPLGCDQIPDISMKSLKFYYQYFYLSSFQFLCCLLCSSVMFLCLNFHSILFSLSISSKKDLFQVVSSPLQLY